MSDKPKIAFGLWRPGSASSEPPSPGSLLAAMKRMCSRMPQQPFIRYVSTEEYAAYCVVAFLQWGAE